MVNRFRGRCPSARTLARLASPAALRARAQGSLTVLAVPCCRGRVSHPLDDIPNFMNSSHDSSLRTSLSWSHRFAYASNGQGFYGIDMQTGREGELAAFPTPDSCWSRTFAKPNGLARPLCHGADPGQEGSWHIRFYQEIASSAFWRRSRRQGQDLADLPPHGKTAIAFQIRREAVPDRGTWAASRRAGRAFCSWPTETTWRHSVQRFTSFNAFADDAMVRVKPRTSQERARCRRRQPVLHHLPDLHERAAREGKPSPYFGRHRRTSSTSSSSTSAPRRGQRRETWRDILTYFAPAVQLGLTATPKRKDNIDTYSTSASRCNVYSLKDGINAAI